jgi:glycosyltransferase involved in cell wall biosynthesis
MDALNPLMSVIIPSYNGAQRLPLVLHHLSQQTFTRFEVIVVLDGSNDSSESVLSANELPFPLTVLNQSNQGAGRARNYGASVARGNILIFIDDDMLIAPDGLQVHADFHAQYPNILVNTAITIRPERITDDFGRYLAWAESQWKATLPAIRRADDSSLPYLAAGYCSVPAHDFKALDGFDPALREQEDRDLAIRWANSGRSIAFLPTAWAYHDVDTSFRRTVMRQRQYAQALQQYLSIRAALVEPYPQLIPRPFSGWRALLMTLVCQKSVLARLLRNGTLGHWLPKTLRYRLYGAMTHALTYHFPDSAM